jgi:hypothetical protein
MYRFSQLSRTIKLAFALTATATLALAQIGTSTITGRVTDSTGAVVPNVAVKVIQKSTNFVSPALTNTDGIYRVLSLQPGDYRVTFEVSGFKKVVRDDVSLRTGDTLAVDAALQVGQVSDSVEVTGSAAALETETSATGAVVTGQVLYDLPLYQRFVNSTLNLVPGMTTGGYAYGGSLGSYHLAGQRAGAIGIFEDGVNGNDQQGGTETTKPILNSVAEVKVMTTLPPAEYGHSAGGVISAVKKSGTNELHAMGSFYGRTRRMQHRLFFDRQTTTQQGVPTFFMMPDANISGPVMIPKVYDGRNKTFFFFGFQRLHEKKVAQVDASVPSLEMRQGIFNWTGANPIYDPATTRLVNGVWPQGARIRSVATAVPAGQFHFHRRLQQLPGQRTGAGLSERLQLSLRSPVQYRLQDLLFLDRQQVPPRSAASLEHPARPRRIRWCRGQSGPVAQPEHVSGQDVDHFALAGE